MLKIAICDDDRYYLEYEERLIREYMNCNALTYEIITFTSSIELLNTFDGVTNYDIIFLDIEMTELNGIETAKQIRILNDKVCLVFVTAFYTYSLEGYIAKAFRYIMKDNESFEGTLKECMDAFLQEKNYGQKKLNFKFREGCLVLFPKDIIYIESKGHRVYFKIVQESEIKTFTQNVKLDEVEKQLKNCGFCRIHKSYLVNLRYVKKIERLQLTLKNGTLLNVSKAKHSDVNKALISFWGEL